MNPTTPMPMPVPGIQIVQPPEEVHRQETTLPSESTKITTASPESADAMQRVQAAGQAELAAGDKVLAAKQPVNRAEALGEDMRANEAKIAQIEREKTRLIHQDIVAGKVAESRRRRAEMEAAAKPTDFWEDRGSAARIVSAFLVGLNQFGNALSGQSGNLSYQILSDEMDRDRQRKMDKFERSKEFAALAARDVEAAEAARAAKLKEIDESEAARIKVIDRQIGALTKRLAIPQAAAAHEQWRAEAAGKLAERDARIAQHYDLETTKQGPKTTISHTTNSNKPQGGSGSTDLAVEAPDGTVYQAKSPAEAQELRSKVASLRSAKESAEKLKALNAQKGRLPDLELQPAIDTESKNLLEKKKDLYGALTAADEATHKGRTVPGLLRSPESANKGLDSFIGGMEADLNAAFKSKATPLQAPAATPARAPAPAPSKPAAKPTPKTSPEYKEALGKRWIRINGKWMTDQ